METFVYGEGWTIVILELLNKECMKIIYKTLQQMLQVHIN